jgi:large subunit ribosomal protein L25
MAYAINAIARSAMGRRAHGELAEKRIPAVVYGKGIDAKPISVVRSEFMKVYKAAGFSSLIDFNVDGSSPVKVLVKEVQVNPISTEPQHIDFYQVNMNEEFEVKVPLVFIGESKAVKQDGGTLVKSLDEIEVRCLPANLPHEIQVDLSKLKTFEDMINVGSIALPAGVTAVTDPLVTIATVARPLTEEELKKLEEGTTADVTTIKTEAEEKKAEADAKKAEEAAAEEAAK